MSTTAPVSERDSYLSTLHLGSNGKLYDGAIPNGELLCEPYSTDEEMLINSGLNIQVLLDKLIKALTRLPKGMQPDDLSAEDRFHIFFHLRNISYPKPYDYPFRCTECNEKAQATIDLQKQLRIKYLGQEELLNALGEPTGEYKEVPFAEPIHVRIPLLGIDVGWRYLRGKDEKLIDQYEKRSKARNPKAPKNVSYQYRMALHIAEIDGVPATLEQAMELVQRLRGQDSLALRDDFDDKRHGVILRVEPECNHCGFPNGPFLLPMEETFFRPRSPAEAGGALGQ